MKSSTIPCGSCPTSAARSDPPIASSFSRDPQGSATALPRGSRLNFSSCRLLLPSSRMTRGSRPSLPASYPAFRTRRECIFMRSTAALLVCLTGSVLYAAPPSPQDIEFFEKNVRPILAAKCQSCHGPKRQQGGLRLDSRAALLKGSDNGAVLVPGEPEKSPFVRVIRYDGDVQMPPKGKLPDNAIADLTAWVKMGAPWPEDVAKLDESAKSIADVRRSHWSFQPVHKPAVPAVKNADRVKTPVDAFVLARLEAKGIAPAPIADRRTLIRRVTLDLHGLPPTPEEVAAFEADRAGRPMLASWIACWRRRATASAGAGTGSTWPATPTPRATSSRRNAAIPSPTPTAITSSAPSTRICPTTSSSCNSWRRIGCRSARTNGRWRRWAF